MLEGLDGSGKNAQIDLLVQYLKSKGKDVLVTKEPTTDSEAGRKIKKVLQKEVSMESLELQKLYVQDRAEHLENQIIPALKKGQFVVSSRYTFSTIAYGAGEGVDIDLLVKMNDNFLLPDIAIILDVLPESCVRRIEARGETKEFFEQKEKLERISKIYSKLPQMFDYAIPVDGNGKVNEVFEKIKEVITPII